jgi:nucleoside-diphosphate-sugar epimerase/intein/homing endonuclease
MARVVVTGGAGFLGSHLCHRLLDRGDEVVCLDNLITGSLSNISDLFGRRGFTFVEHDVSTYMWVPGPVDAVMHFASPASPVDFDRIPIQILKVGSLGTHNALGLAKAKGARFFLASTSEVYGDPLVHPQPETYWGNVNPIGPRGVYDEAKRFAEAMTFAYHRHHGLDVRVVRIFNSILADEQVLYDDGRELRRETAGELAARLGGIVDLAGFEVPAFDGDGEISSSTTTAFVGHPTAAPCFEVRTRYGRSIRVTGDHSLFVRGEDGLPVARPVSALSVGDKVAIAGRVDVPVRDRHGISMVEVWDESGGDPYQLLIEAPGLGAVAWDRRAEVHGFLTATRKPSSASWRNAIWGQIFSMRDRDRVPLAVMRRLGLALPPGASCRIRSAGRSIALPAVVPVSDELLWLLGLYVAEGCWSQTPHDSSITISADVDLLDRAAKVIQRELGLHVVRAPGSAQRSPAIAVHGRLLLHLLASLGFGGGRKRIPGWILGLPLERLRWFLEGYREGDGVHSGKKFDEQIRHEFSTTSTELKDDLIVALARFGIVPSVGRYETTFKQRTGDRRYPFWRLTIPRISPWSPLDWHRGVDQPMQVERTGDLVWAQVKEIVPVAATPLVYDFCVPGRENFWAGSGVMAHNTYGPQMRPDDGRAVSNFVVQALRGDDITVYGDGSQTRSFCYVDDEVRGFLALLDSDVVGPVNIGNPHEYTILELAEMVVDVVGSGSKIVFEPLPVDDPTQRQPDITRAVELLGWQPEVDLRTGIERTTDYFRQVLAAGG